MVETPQRRVNLLTRGLVGVAVAALAVGLAGQASADVPSGSYTATVVNGGLFFTVGFTSNWTISPCGPDCAHLQTQDTPIDLHRQGDTWTGTHTNARGRTCIETLDGSLTFMDECPGGTVIWQLTKNG
jgi:hypothetical protein